jgi:hypothetical protein
MDVQRSSSLGRAAPGDPASISGSRPESSGQQGFVRPVTREGLEGLMPLFQTYAFNPYRNYRAFTRRTQTDVLFAQAEATLGEPETFAFSAGGDEPASAVMARRLPWDSEFFGLPMARIDRILGEDTAACQEALTRTLARLRAAGVRHVAARADVADIATAALLQDHGFRLMGGLSTFVARPRREPPNAVRSLGNIRFMRDEDGPELVALATHAFRGFRSRFHADPKLPRERADALYVEWARRCAAREMADVVLVAEGKEGRLLGFNAFRRVEPVSTRSGLLVFGGALGACRPDMPGASLGLVRAGALWAHEHGGVFELQTPFDNFACIAVFEAVGLRLRRSEYDFHLWLD